MDAAIMSLELHGRGSHVAAHLTNQAPGKATLNSLHFNILEGVTK